MSESYESGVASGKTNVGVSLFSLSLDDEHDDSLAEDDTGGVWTDDGTLSE